VSATQDGGDVTFVGSVGLPGPGVCREALAGFTALVGELE
jgi:hypothetical protein